MRRWTLAVIVGGGLLLGGCGAQPNETRQKRDGDPKTSAPSGQPQPDSELPPPDSPTRELPESVGEVEPSFSATPPDEPNRVVQVFYATDRRPLGHNSFSGQERLADLYGWATVAGVVTIFFIGVTIRSPRRIRYGVLALIAAGWTLKLVHSGIIRGQQLDRAAQFGDRVYGSDRHEVDGLPVIEYGTCEVSIPPDHRVGQVETPSLLRFEFHEDPDKHVIVQRTVRQPEDEFFAELQRVVEKSTGRQAFVFVHGYNVGFDGAVRRTAQIAYDLEFDGAPICYSWPSQGGVGSYTYDEASVDWSVLQLETLLKQVRDRSGASTVHVIAHSMGNRVLVEALERMALRGEAERYRFGQMILAAPDVDAGAFRTRYVPLLIEMAQRVTMYASSNDKALKASTELHGYSRAGWSGESLLIVPGLETVDASPIDTSLIGHSYYGDNPEMIRDLRTLVEDNIPASAREWLSRVVRRPQTFYWVFRQ